MNDLFYTIAEVVRNRRSTKPAKMNGKKIPGEEIKELLQLANWAPTHGRTEPWKFIVYSENAVGEFCKAHAELYQANTSPDKFDQSNYDKQLHNGDLASHIIVAAMQRGSSPKIPALEEIASTAAAIQNLLLGASAAGMAAFWSTGGMTHHSSMKGFLQLKDEDIVMGILYLGYTDEQVEGKRQTGIEEKTSWK